MHTIAEPIDLQARMGTAESELESMLSDESVEPRALPLSLLEKITHGFSDNLVIGRGGFAVTYKGILDNGAVIAVKKIHPSYISDKNFQGEVASLMKVKHKNIVRFLGYCADTKGSMEMFEGQFVMAVTQERLMCFEYLPKGSLEHYIKDTSGDVEWRNWYIIIRGICEGLNYLHQHNILHLDLKPANILMDEDMMPKIIDFGGSRFFEDKQTHVTATKIMGTMGYMAPELIFGRQITYKSDLYSLGVIITEILTGEKGYHNPEDVLESWRSRSDKSQWAQIQVCSEIGIECIENDPVKRPDIKRIIDRLSEIGSTQVIQAHGPSELLGFHQYALYFPLEPNKIITCPLKLTNNTDRCVAFRLMYKSGDSFLRLPLYGIVPPRSPYTLLVTAQEHNEKSQMKTTCIILSTAVVLEHDYIREFQRQPDNFFQKARDTGDVVQEVTLEAFSIPRQEETYLKCMLFEEDAKPNALPFSLLKEITKGFSDELEIGRGVCTVVYKGMLDNGTIIAVKRLPKAYLHQKEFHVEVNCLMEVKHKNVVQFLGYCAETIGTMMEHNGKLVMADIVERLLCFEYLPKGNLQHYIKDSSEGLEWSKRYKIIKGVCEGLSYIHKKNILHLGLKPTNILLDEDMNPKLTDFGKSKYLEEGRAQVITTKIGGILTYLGPEFFSDDITYKLDLHNLGVIIIQILIGKNGYPLVEDVLESWSNRTDSSQREQIQVCVEIGRECIDSNRSSRPISMKHIIDRLLETESTQIISTGRPESTQTNPAGKFFETEGTQVAPAGSYLERESTQRIPAADELLVLHQFTLCFQFVPNKTVTCPLQLTNKTDKHVAFRLIDKGCESFLRLPSYGIVPPRSPYTLFVTTEEHKELPRNCNMDLILHSVTLLWDEYIDSFKRQPENFFKKANNMANVVCLKAFYTQREETIDSPKMESKPHHMLFEYMGSNPHRMTLQYLRDITNNFSEERILGRGGFGVVYKGVLQSGKMIAVKKLVLAVQSTHEHFENELNHLMKLGHPNIVRLEGYCQEKQNLHMPDEGKLIFVETTENFLCFEYLPNGSLDHYISDASSGLNWETRWKIIGGITRGLQYLHEQSNGPIIHLDLKPANIMLDEYMVPKIGDFGQSRLFDQRQTIFTSSICGTLGYMSPEYLLRGIITPMSDIFSLGVIIVEVTTGHRDYPYDCTEASEAFIEIELNKWRNVLKTGPECESLETNCKQIRRCIQIGLLCLNPERKKRPTMNKIIDMLQELKEEEKKKDKKKGEEGDQRTHWWPW